MSDPSEASRLRRFLGELDWGLAIVAALSFGSAGYVLATEGTGVAKRLLAEDAWLFLGILPKVLLGCLIGAFIRRLIPREAIERHVGEGSGLRGLAIATAIGALFPAGPFTIFPLAAMLAVSGADRGAALAFVSGWLLIGVNRAIIWEMPFFGTDFVLARFLLSAPMPLLIGALARAPVFDRIVPRAPRTGED